jgi:putative endonuclease
MLSELRRKVERSARLYLEMRGYKILEQNWGRGQYKIDIIALKGNKIHFIDVNYNKNMNEQSSIETLTESKLKQMRSAIEVWSVEAKFKGPYAYEAIDIIGPDFTVIGFNEILN